MGWAERLNYNSWYNRSKVRREREVKMENALTRSLKRLVRSTLGLVIAGAIAYTNKDPKLLLFAPVIQASAKYLRDKFNLEYLPL